jgi:hypothetical protein
VAHASEAREGNAAGGAPRRTHCPFSYPGLIPVALVSTCCDRRKALVPGDAGDDGVRSRPQIGIAPEGDIQVVRMRPDHEPVPWAGKLSPGSRQGVRPSGPRLGTRARLLIRIAGAAHCEPARVGDEPFDPMKRIEREPAHRLVWVVSIPELESVGIQFLIMSDDQADGTPRRTRQLCGTKPTYAIDRGMLTP